MNQEITNEEIVTMLNRVLMATRELTIKVDKCEMDTLTLGNTLVKKKLITKSELKRELSRLLLVKKEIIDEINNKPQMDLVEKMMNVVRTNEKV